jgi:hypothetical protein
VNKLANGQDKYIEFTISRDERILDKISQLKIVRQIQDIEVELKSFGPKNKLISIITSRNKPQWDLWSFNKFSDLESYLRSIASGKTQSLTNIPTKHGNIDYWLNSHKELDQITVRIYILNSN